MKFAKECLLALLDTFNALMGMPTNENEKSLGFGGRIPHVPHVPQASQALYVPENPFQLGNDLPTEGKNPLIFQPPGHIQNKKTGFTCNYTNMGDGWRPCSTDKNRGCWLQGPGTEQYNISTNYEFFAPKGITRHYELNVTEMEINADGVPNPYGKVFNKSYPGPWIEACWGDEIEITVRNMLRHNGTAIHWHGIRMWNTTEMDGVNAVSQCPIAPGEAFTYKFKTWQYGTSWYHSHYSLQYGDGLLGPLTIHGPATADYDEQIDPILMTDWNHRSAFMDFQKELEGNVPKMDSILLNGEGNYAGVGRGEKKYNKIIKYGKRYLLRLINTSVDTTFVFSIDHHNLTVITTDFVPIVPYSTDHIMIGIGQRYHVIVEAKPLYKNNSIVPQEEATKYPYWLRTIPAKNCNNFMIGGMPEERQGIINYHNNTIVPSSERPDFNLSCRDEDVGKLKPYISWNIPATTQDFNDKLGNDSFEVGLDVPKAPDGRPFPCDKFYRWSIGHKPMFLNFSDPTILHLEDHPSMFPDRNVVIDAANYTKDAWVYMLITGMYGDGRAPKDEGRDFKPAAHPIHLHGHDFALLQQASYPLTRDNFEPNYKNPPRRDVVLLPASGFIAIAFRADNPGAWALHCHIAWHASGGLALQVLERATDAQAFLDARPDKKEQIHNTCEKWKKWYSNSTNFWDKERGQLGFQDDSGV